MACNPPADLDLNQLCLVLKKLEDGITRDAVLEPVGEEVSAEVKSRL
jgi:hypothetical protein